MGEIAVAITCKNKTLSQQDLRKMMMEKNVIFLIGGA